MIRKVTEEDFYNIKLLTKKGFSMTETARLTGRSHSTINYIRRSNKFEDYKQIVAERFEKLKAKKANEAKTMVDTLTRTGVKVGEITPPIYKDKLSETAKLTNAINRLTATIENKKGKRWF